MKKYKNMKIALVNGPHRHNARPKYLMQTAEDIVRIRNIVKDMKFKLKFAIDISKLMKKKNYRGDFGDDFNRLSEMRNAIVGIHLSGKLGSASFMNRRYKDDNVYLNKFEYPQNSDFLGSISALLNDNLCRYFVPEGMNSIMSLKN